MSLIRATRFGLFELLRDRARVQQSDLRAAQERALTGLRINRPSDAPTALSEVHRLDATVRSQQVFAGNAGGAGDLLAVADSALSSVADILVRAREIAVAMAGDTVGGDSRAVAAVEVRGLYEALRDAANTEFGGRYLFSGTAWDTAPFDDTGVYQGNTDEPAVQVGGDHWVTNGFDGSAVFAGTVDIFAALDTLATALESDDPDSVSSALGDLDAGTDQISSWRARVGTEQVLAEDAQAVAENLSSILSERLADLAEADPTETYLEISELQGAYEATLRLASTSTRQTLFDLL